MSAVPARATAASAAAGSRPPDLRLVPAALSTWAVVLLGLASLARGWRWWHTLTLVAAWFALGSARWYHPSSWASDWPFFASAHVVTRWRFVALLGLGIGTALIGLLAHEHAYVQAGQSVPLA